MARCPGSFTGLIGTGTQDLVVRIELELLFSREFVRADAFFDLRTQIHL